MPRSARILLAAWCVLLAFALLAPCLAQDPYLNDFTHGLDAAGGPSAPSAAHWLGTDRLFRDELARLAVASRRSLAIGAGAAGGAVLLGALVGLVAGFAEGGPGLHLTLRRRTLPLLSYDALIVFLLDMVQSFPFLLLVLALSAMFERITDTVTVLVLACTGWLSIARIVRAKTIQLKNMDFVVAARSLGRGTAAIATVHVLPNLVRLLGASFSLLMAQMIAAESVLSYLGLGGAPDVPTWGRMLAEGQQSLFGAPWLFFTPAVALVLTALLCQLGGLQLQRERTPR